MKVGMRPVVKVIEDLCPGCGECIDACTQWSTGWHR